VRVGQIVARLAGGLVLIAGLAAAVNGFRASDGDNATVPVQGGTAFQRANVEWLLEHRLPCRGCHVIDGRGGQLGPDLTGVGQRLDAGAIATHVTSPGTRVATSIMPPVPMPGKWRALLVAYLAGADGDVGSEGVAVAAITPEAPGVRHPSIDGQTLYVTLCSGCHGGTGAGDGPNASSLPVRPARLADATVMATRSDDWLFDIVARGGYVMNRHPYMPAYVDLLSPEQIRRVVAHLRRLCRCAGPSWSDPRAK
jgi:mono/diheme cytochrome c family protein